MAKVKYGGGIQDIRGSIAGQTHSRNTFGNYVRQKVSPVQPRSGRQLEARKIFTGLSRRYSSVLSDDQQEAWRQAAASATVRDVFGDSITLTGINLYCRLNGVRSWLGLSPLDDPPPIEEVEGLESLSLSWDPTQNALNLAWTPSPVPTDRFLLVWATEPVNPGVAFVAHKLRLLAVLWPGETSPYDIIGFYTERFGPPVAGKAVYVAAELVSSNGWKGPRSLAKTRIQ